MSALIEEIYSHFREMMPLLPENHEEGLLEWRISTLTGDCPECHAVFSQPSDLVHDLTLLPIRADDGQLAEVQLVFSNDLEYHGRIRVAAGSW